ELKQADELRRDGQDRLFFSPAQRGSARQPLEQARTKYQAVLDKAAVVRAAQAQAALAALELPYLTHWRSRLAVDPQDEARAEELLAPKKKAWQDLYALRALLDEPAWEKIQGEKSK